MGWLLLLLLVPALWLGWCYNRLIRGRNKINTAWSDVDVQLLRRHDLIPNLVALVGQYSHHEQATQLAAASARGQTAASRSQSESAVSQQLVQLLAVAEAYPELKAEQRFADLHQQLVAVEDEIQYARRYFNGAVRDFNNLVQSFPTLLVAPRLGFQPRPFFELPLATQRLAPEVKL